LNPQTSLVLELAGGRLRDGRACWLVGAALLAPLSLVLPFVIKRNNPVKERIPRLKAL
jgi:hypothetical protein